MRRSGSWAVPGIAAAALAQAVAGLAALVLVASPSTWSVAPAAVPGAGTDRRGAAVAFVSGSAPEAAPVASDAASGAPRRAGSAFGAISTRKGPPGGGTRPASTVFVGPPFYAATAVTGCFPPGPQCRTDVSSRPQDGRSVATVAVTSPAGGLAPGVGSAQAYAGVVAQLRLPAGAHRVVIAAVVDVSRADVGHELGPVALPPLGSRAQLVLQEVAVHSVCGGWGCFATALSPLASLDEGPSLNGGHGPVLGTSPVGERRLEVAVANPYGPLPAGIVSVAVQVYARAELGNMSASGASPDVGTVHATAAFRLERIEATVS